MASTIRVGVIHTWAASARSHSKPRWHSEIGDRHKSVTSPYSRYLELDSVVALAEELNAQGHRTKVQVRASGPHRGGCIFRRGTLYHLLSNPIYLGKMVHKGDVFEGEHPAIVPIDLWNAAQAKLKVNASGTSRRLGSKQPSLLVGLVFDGEGRPMTPSHATKPGKRYRYYVTRPDQLDDAPAWRVSAYDLENIICDQLSALLTDQHFICNRTSDVPAGEIEQALAKADLAAAALRSSTARNKALLLAKLVQRIDLQEEGVDLTIDRTGLDTLLGLEAAAFAATEALVITLPATKVRRGHQLRLIIPGPQSLNITPTTRDEKLVALIAEAHAARKLILANPEQSIASIAAGNSRCRTRLGKLVALACLAPDIVTAIVEGRQPVTLTARTMQDIDLPLAWAEQRALLGFA